MSHNNNTRKSSPGRPRSRPVPLRMSASERAIVMQFLQVRLDQSRNGLRKLCHGLSVAEITANRGQIDWFRTEESVILRLISTVNHPIGYSDPTI